MTRPDHDAFEGTLGLLDTELELAYYKIVLTRFHGFWRGWQPYVAGLLDDETLLAPRRRLELLDADLRTLGLSKSDIEALPTCPPPRLENAAEALGSLYVMEGSTLGGRRILRNVERCLGLSEHAGCQYFAGYGAQTGPMWQAFLQRLDRAPPEQAADVANGAVATFQALGRWLRPAGRPPLTHARPPA
jgi:heme oxygenase